MRAFLYAFVLPMGVFWGWYLLAVNDVGYFMFTREMHDQLFKTYGDMLGIDPQTIPPLVARACVIDTLLVLAIWAFRRRREIAAWYKARRLRNSEAAARRYSEASSPPIA